jgi:FMN phosphatase YigB (HAD superfamily)
MTRGPMELTLSQVIRNTFTPFLKPDQEVPPALISDLLRQYSTKEGYKLYPEVLPFFRMLRKRKSRNSPSKIIVGIITNSDDRVPGILEDFGLIINSRRFVASAEPLKVRSKSAEMLFAGSDEDSRPSPGTNPRVRSADPESHDDVDFVILSYDVGHEKPNRRMFDAASATLHEMLANHDSKLDASDFWKLYVGDDLNKDYMAARQAGWAAVLVDRADILGDLHDYAVRTALMEVGEAYKPIFSNEGPVTRKVDVAKTLLGVRKYIPPIQDQENDPEGQEVLAGEVKEKTQFIAEDLEGMRQADADEKNAKE